MPPLCLYHDWVLYKKGSKCKQCGVYTDVKIETEMDEINMNDVLRVIEKGKRKNYVK